MRLSCWTGKRRKHMDVNFFRMYGFGEKIGFKIFPRFGVVETTELPGHIRESSDVLCIRVIKIWLHTQITNLIYYRLSWWVLLFPLHSRGNDPVTNIFAKRLKKWRLQERTGSETQNHSTPKGIVTFFFSPVGNYSRFPLNPWQLRVGYELWEVKWSFGEPKIMDYGRVRVTKVKRRSDCNTFIFFLPRTLIMNRLVNILWRLMGLNSPINLN